MKQELSAKATPFTVLVGEDAGRTRGYAFDRAARIASRIPGSLLHVVHVVAVDASEGEARQRVSELRRYVTEEARALGGMDGQEVGVHVRSGQVEREIARLATELNADLIVLGTRRLPHVNMLHLGAVVSKLVATSACPVLIAGPKRAIVEGLEPTIEPPCSECVRARAASHGAVWWCTRHTRHALTPHRYRYQHALPFDQHDSEVIPTGV